MIKKIMKKFVFSILIVTTIISCCSITVFAESPKIAEATGHRKNGVSYINDDEEQDYLGLKQQIIQKNIESIGDYIVKIDGNVNDVRDYLNDVNGNIDQLRGYVEKIGGDVDAFNKYVEKQNAKDKKKKIKDNIVKNIQGVEKAAVTVINLVKQEDKNWAGFAFDAGKMLANSIASIWGFGGVSDGVFNIIDALLPGASPLSETAVLSNKIGEEFDKVGSQLTDIEKEIAELSNTINSESNRIISEVSAQLDALDARQYVRTFTFSGEGNFSYNQFYNYIYGLTDSSNVYYNQAYYNALLEAIIHGASEEDLKICYDNLYSALMSTAINGQSNYIMLYEYLTGDKSVSQYYYDYISKNRQLLNGDETAEEQALEYAKEKYFTALAAGALIQTCNTYQLNCMMEEYGDTLNGNSKYYYNRNTGEYITYNELVQNVYYIINNKEVLLQSLLKDIAYITNMGSSYMVEENNGYMYIVADNNAETFGQVVSGQKIYINQVYEELIEDIEGCNLDDFKYYINGIQTSPEIIVGNANFSVAVYFHETQLFTINFYVGAKNTFNGGDGTTKYPYNISNASQLNLASNNLSANYRLIADIDCVNNTMHVIGDAKDHFKGVFDGNGHTISNLSIISTAPNDETKPLYVGLFGYNEGSVKNLTIKYAGIQSDYQKDGTQANISESYYFNGILAGYNEGTINNCIIQNSALTVVRHNEILNRNITVYAGGLVGSNYGRIENCSIEGVAIDASSYHSYEAESDSNNKNNVYVGGIAGESHGYITNGRVDSATNLSAFAESYCNAKNTTKYPYINVYAGGIAAVIGEEKNVQYLYSAAQISKCSYDRKNKGSGGSLTHHCFAKSHQYIPNKDIKGVNNYNDVYIPNVTNHTAEISYVGEVQNNSQYLDASRLSIKIDENTIDYYSILGVYGFDSKNTNLSSTSQNYVTIVFSCEIDNEVVILSDSLFLTIAKNEIDGISVNKIAGTYKYGDTNLSGKSAFITLNYSSGNRDSIETTDYSIGFIGEQTSLQYGDNKVLVTYKGLTAEYIINIECLHDYRYERVEATCAHAGYEYGRCTLCGEEEMISYTEKLTRHSFIVVEEAYAANCEHEGSTGKVYCLECGYVFVEESILPKIAHSYVKFDETEHRCSECGHAEAHQFIVSESINENGNIVYLYTCLNCDYAYTEIDTNTITAEINSLPTLAVSDGFALNGGDLVTVYVQLLNNPGITGANFGIRYDERLTLVSWSEGTILPNTVSEDNPVNCGWNYFWGAAATSYAEKGNVLTLVFRIPYNANLNDKYNVNLVYGLIPSSDGGFILDDGKTFKKFITRAGTISIVEHLPGDANDDGVVDLMDAIYTAQYAVGKITEINDGYVDVNLDGIVDSRDVIYSLRGLTGGYGINFLNQEFEVVLNTNGADITYDNLIVSIYGDNNVYKLPNDPIRAGYTFLGWNTRIYGNDGRFIKDGDVVVYDSKQLTQTLYARWAPNRVEFNMNGATSGQVDGLTYSTSNIYIRLPQPEKEYSIKLYYGEDFKNEDLLGTNTFVHEFLYWLDEKTQNHYYAGEDYMLNVVNGGVVTLKAVWGEYVLNGSLISKKTGYEFNGYYYKTPMVKTLIEGDGTFDSDEMDAWISSTPEEDRKLCGAFAPITRTISFNADGGSGSPESLEVTYGFTISRVKSPSKSGYNFDGWYINDVLVIDERGDVVKGTPYFDWDYKSIVLENQFVKAKWTVKQYTVTFDDNSYNDDSVNGDSSDITVTYDSAYGVLPALTRTGYTLDGWYTAKNGGTLVENSSIVDTAKDHILYAHWTPNKYTVTFNATNNGGMCDIATKEVVFNTSYGELPDATKTGYKFLGWSLSSQGSVISEDAKVTKAMDHTLYALFADSANSYTVIFDYNGGNEIRKEQVVVFGKYYGASQELPETTKTYYDFKGWFTSPTGGTRVTNSTIVTTAESHTLYAHWELHEYTVSGTSTNGTVYWSTSSITTSGGSTMLTGVSYGTTLYWRVEAEIGYDRPSTYYGSSVLNDSFIFDDVESTAKKYMSECPAHKYTISGTSTNGIVYWSTSSITTSGGSTILTGVSYGTTLYWRIAANTGYDRPSTYYGSLVLNNTNFTLDTTNSTATKAMSECPAHKYTVSGTSTNGMVYWSTSSITTSGGSTILTGVSYGSTIYWRTTANIGYDNPAEYYGSLVLNNTNFTVDTTNSTATKVMSECPAHKYTVSGTSTNGTVYWSTSSITTSGGSTMLTDVSYGTTLYWRIVAYSGYDNPAEYYGSLVLNNTNFTVDTTNSTATKVMSECPAHKYTVSGTSTNGTVYWSTSSITTSGGSTTLTGVSYGTRLYWRIAANTGYDRPSTYYGSLILNNSNFILDASNATKPLTACTANSYKITFDANTSVLPINVSLSSDSGTITYSTTTISNYATESSSYFDIDGWYTAKSGGTKIAEANGALLAKTSYTDASKKWTYPGNVKLYAQWKNAGSAVCIANSKKTATVNGVTYIYSKTLSEIGTSGSYILIEDINLGRSWSPISSFGGTLDGNGFSIYNYTISDTFTMSSNEYYLGLIRTLETGGVIKNLCIGKTGFTTSYSLTVNNNSGSNQTRDSYLGTIAGQNKGQIIGCKVENVSLTGYSRSDHGSSSTWRTLSLGGVCGINRGTIKQCSVANTTIDSTSAVKYDGQFGTARAGGIVGYNESVITDCLVTAKAAGSIKAHSCSWGEGLNRAYDVYSEVGGIAGACGYKNSQVSIEHCVIIEVANYLKATNDVAYSASKGYSRKGSIVGRYKAGSDDSSKFTYNLNVVVNTQNYSGSGANGSISPKTLSNSYSALVGYSNSFNSANGWQQTSDGKIAMRFNAN